MDDPVTRFLKHAASVRLSEDERSSARESLKRFMRLDAVRKESEGRHAQGMTFSGRRDSLPALKDAEKRAVQNELIRFMKRNPAEQRIPAPIPHAGGWQGAVSTFFGVILPRTAAFTVLFIVVGSGVAYAAQDTLPGDTLYPVKVGIVEPLLRSFAFTAEAKAELDARLALRRLEEATQLAAENALTEEQSRNLNGVFLQHVENVERHIEEVARMGDNDKAERLSADLEMYLQAHHSVIDTVGRDRRDNPQIERVLQNVKQAEQQASRMRSAHSADSNDATKQREEMTDAAHRKVMQALAATAGLRQSLSRADREDGAAQRKLREAEMLLGEANAQLNAGQADAAIAVAREALKFAEEGRLLLSLPADIGDDDVSGSRPDMNETDESLNSSSSSSGDDDEHEQEEEHEQTEDKTIVPDIPAILQDAGIGIDTDLVGL